MADRCRGWAWVALRCPSLPSLRGSLRGGFCGVSWRLLGVSGIFVGLAASAALRAFCIVFAAWWCGWWCPASRRGVGADPRRLVALSGRGVVGGSSRRLGVVPGLLWWRRDGLRGCALVLGLSSFRGGCDGLVRRLLRALSICRGGLSCGAGGRSRGRCGWVWVCGRGGLRGLVRGLWAVWRA